MQKHYQCEQKNFSVKFHGLVGTISSSVAKIAGEITFKSSSTTENTAHILSDTLFMFMVVSIDKCTGKNRNGTHSKNSKQSFFHFFNFLFYYLLNISSFCGRITPSQSRPRVIIYSSITPPFCKKKAAIIQHAGSSRL